MYVADNIERTMIVTAVIPQRLAFDRRRFDFFRRVENEDMPKPFSLEHAQRTAQLLPLLSDHVGTEIAIGSVAIPFVTQPLGNIKNDRYRNAMILPRYGNQRFVRFRLNVGRINHGETRT